MHALARALPDKISSWSGAARDLTATTSDFTRRELDRARELSGVLRQRLGALVDPHTRASVVRLSRRELDRARDLGGALQQRLGAVVSRDRRSSRLPLVASAVVVGVVVGGAILASPYVRASLRKGWDLLFRRRTGEAAPMMADGPERVSSKPVQARQEDLLDEGIEESFPASDPVSVHQIT